MKKGALDTKRTSAALLVLLLIICTFIVYGQTLTYDFVWDDKDPNLIENRYLQYTSFKNVLHFWTKPYAQMYIPVPYTTWALIKEIGTLIPWGQRVDGFNPFAFHLFSILFHIFNGLLVFRILKLLIKNEWSAFFGTLIFILHPLQVESVVWITEFRGLLAAFFGFSSLYILINNEILKKKNISKSCLTIRYINSLILFVFGMLSKPSVIVIPAFAFIIYLLYFKEKFWQSFKKLIPFIVVTIPFIIMLRFVQPASYHTEVAPLWSRFFIWMDTINFYFLKTLIPYPLVVTYTRTFQTLLPKYWFYLEWIIPVLLVFFAVKLYKRNPIILLGLLLFIVGFLPVSGLVSFVFQKWSNVADRYVYFSMFGLGLVIAWLLAKYHNKLVWILLLDILLCFTLLTILIQIPVWKNSLTLWNHALIHGRPSTYAYNNRGIALQNNGEYEMALEDYKKSIILNSLHTKSYYNIGIVYSKNERPDSAITYYNKAIAQRKDYIDAYLNRGVAYVSLEEYDKAISDYNFVINLRSDDEMAYSNRGILYFDTGNLCSRGPWRLDSFRRLKGRSVFFIVFTFNL